MRQTDNGQDGLLLSVVFIKLAEQVFWLQKVRDCFDAFPYFLNL